MDHRQPGRVERLAAADRRIEKAKALIVRQEVLVARLAAAGADGTLAREVPEEMRRSLREMYVHRRLILGEVEEAASPSRQDRPSSDGPARPGEGAPRAAS